VPNNLLGTLVAADEAQAAAAPGLGPHMTAAGEQQQKEEEEEENEQLSQGAVGGHEGAVAGGPQDAAYAVEAEAGAVLSASRGQQQVPVLEVKADMDDDDEMADAEQVRIC